MDTVGFNHAQSDSQFQTTVSTDDPSDHPSYRDLDQDLVVQDPFDKFTNAEYALPDTSSTQPPHIAHNAQHSTSGGYEEQQQQQQQQQYSFTEHDTADFERFLDTYGSGTQSYSMADPPQSQVQVAAPYYTATPSEQLPQYHPAPPSRPVHWQTVPHLAGPDWHQAPPPLSSPASSTSASYQGFPQHTMATPSHQSVRSTGFLPSRHFDQDQSHQYVSLSDLQTALAGLKESHEADLVSDDYDEPRLMIYGGVSVYEIKVRGILTMRRTSDGWLNGTQILKVAGVQEFKRRMILKGPIPPGECEKVQGGSPKYQEDSSNNYSLIEAPPLSP
ncbi:hypothetical protein CLAFUW4_14822 [Fulvia fulva]|nr:hypothetical protein CLAFUR0_14815 [Fulvia fulva]WPV22995.1 hypothetical protein CLAFUW4_14822 [Fulvia fulva]WPV37948.1 hypothetical protein CLAFUW7_14823 [Fulvia fulva]